MNEPLKQKEFESQSRLKQKINAAFSLKNLCLDPELKNPFFSLYKRSGSNQVFQTGSRSPDNSRLPHRHHHNHDHQPPPK